VRGGAGRRAAVLLAAAAASAVVLITAVMASRSGAVPVTASGGRTVASESRTVASESRTAASGGRAGTGPRTTAEPRSAGSSVASGMPGLLGVLRVPGVAGLPGIGAYSGRASAAVGSLPGGTAAVALSPAARRACPAAAAACVDLADHLTWLQSGGQISYGPVRMEPGSPGTPNATPRGTFRVSWKAGPHLVSNEYDEPMPYAVFFAPGGVAFHGGSLTKPSHGCVHLTIANAHYYNDHLPIGAEVVVF
jgi:lipoprotein-anchoring transpeptidase ErfK/SrfK